MEERLPKDIPERLLIIAGAPKSGTTSLARWLQSCRAFRRHISKEPGYFRPPHPGYWLDSRKTHQGTHLAQSIEAYVAGFQGVAPDQWALDASTDYLSADGAAARIKAFSAHCAVKVVVILRDPVERAYSEWQHTIRDGLEHLDFRQSVECEAMRRAEDFQPLFHHERRSRYFEDLRRYRDTFGEDFLILDFQEISSPADVVRKVHDFAGAPFEGLPEHHAAQKANVSHGYAAPGARRLLTDPTIQRVARRIAPPATRRYLRSGAERLLRKRLVLSDADRTWMRARLEDDIRRCVADPDIPTDNWPSARPMSDRLRSRRA